MKIFMIDFIKIWLRFVTPELISALKDLGVRIIVEERTGEIDQKKFADIGSLRLIIMRDSYYLIQGSLHKHYTDGFNDNDYTFHDLLRTLKELKSIFNIDLKESFIQNIEIGWNIDVSYDPDEILSDLIEYKGHPFQNFQNYPGHSIGKKCVFRQYELKFYNKRKQGGRYNNLRIEIKFRKAIAFRKFGVETLEDLTKGIVLWDLANHLLRIINDITMDDKRIDLEQLCIRDSIVIRDGRNPDFWTGLRGQTNRLKRFRIKFNSVVIKYRIVDTKSHLLELSQEKINNLMKIDQKVFAAYCDLYEF